MKVEMNPRRRSRKSRSRRRRSKNPSMSLRRPLGALTSGFKPKSMGEAVPLAGGVLLNFLASSFVSSKFSMVSKGIPSYIAGIGLAGLSGLVPKYGPKLFAGGLTFQILRAINSVLPDKVRLGEDYDSDEYNLAELIERPAMGMRGMDEILWSTGQPSPGSVILD
jgi:hypothetical protein